MFDTVDELHAAEDHIGVLKHAIRRIAEALAEQRPRPGDRLEEAIASAMRIVEDTYCRGGSCMGTGNRGVEGTVSEWGDEERCPADCGCPCHYEEDDDDN